MKKSCWVSGTFHVQIGFGTIADNSKLGNCLLPNCMHEPDTEVEIWMRDVRTLQTALPHYYIMLT